MVKLEHIVLCLQYVVAQNTKDKGKIEQKSKLGYALTNLSTLLFDRNHTFMYITTCHVVGSRWNDPDS